MPNYHTEPHRWDNSWYACLKCGRPWVRGKRKTIKSVFTVFPVSTQHQGERAKTDWLGIRIISPSGATCLHADYCFSEVALYKFC